MKKRMRNALIGAGVLAGCAVCAAVIIWNVRRVPKRNPNVTEIPSGELHADVVSLSDEEVPLGKKVGDLVVETDADIHVIPDKYNTGAKGSLKKVKLGDTVCGIQLKADGSKTKNVFDFAYGNHDISGTIVIEGYDFSANDVVFYNESTVERNISLVFKNCSFSGVSKSAEKNSIHLEFENCSFHNFNGSNATFERCFFGGSCYDGLNPYSNVKVCNCYFARMNDTEHQGKGLHTDGTQIYGKKDLLAEDIEFSNCRFEIPAIPLGENGAVVNACIMLQLEFCNGQNIHFSDCIANGGGYTIYAWSKYDDFALTDSSIEKISIGCSKTFGTFYPVISKGVTIDDLSETDNLYIGSVWKEGKKTHISVTNDTNQKRKLMVYTDKGTFSYEIAPCPLGSQLTEKTRFEDLPFDQDVVIPKDCAYVVCFDTTFAGMEKQIRFVNWKGKKVYVSINENTKTNAAIPVILSGECGKNVTFSLTQDGVLTLSGTGSTYDYHSQALPPWENYKYMIKTVKVESGVERLGNQLFNTCTAISRVTLGEGLKEFGHRTFAGCTSLLSMELPESLINLGSSTFAGSTVFTLKCSQSMYEQYNWCDEFADRMVVK